MHIILGSGVTSYVIASCLEHLGHQDIEIQTLPQFSNVKIPPIMYLKYDNDTALQKYFSIFNIDNNAENIAKYTKRVNVGFYYDFKIHDTCTTEAKRMYLQKQGREFTETAMSDGCASFNAIDIAKIMPLCMSRFASRVKIVDVYQYNDTDVVYGTIPIDLNASKDEPNEWLFLCKNDIGKYDYVYDCSPSNIKRYAKGSVEFISDPVNLKTISFTNYYAKPMTIYQNNIIYIGRLATKTQTKQSDVIDFILNKKDNI